MIFTTKLRAINVETGELATFNPQIHVTHVCAKFAQDWLTNNGFGFLEVDGIFCNSFDYNGENKIFNPELN